MYKRIYLVYLLLCLAFCAVFLAGCSGTELENKVFPLAVLIAEKDGQYSACYLAQQLSEVSNERADGGNMTAESAAGSTYYETHNTFEKNNRCKLDTAHTKALIFQKDFIKSDTLEVFLETLRQENTYARNTLIYLTDSSMEQLVKLNNTLEIPLGSYLEQMTENEQEIKEQAAVTLGALLNEQANASRTLLIPVIRAENGLPVIYEYEVLQNFDSKGRISTEKAQIYYLLAGHLQQMDVYLSEKEQVRLSHLKCKRDFVMSADRITEQITLTAEAKHVSGEVSQAAIEQEIEEKIEKLCSSGREELGIDLSDSGRYLAMRAPEVYRAYGEQMEEYRKKLSYEAKVKIQVISS